MMNNPNNAPDGADANDEHADNARQYDELAVGDDERQ